MTNLLVKHWAGKAEQLVYVFGNQERQGYVASTVRGVTRVPHRVTAPGVRLAEKHRRSTTPLKALRDGAFMGDEFVHDPGLWGYAQAATPNDLAIRFADNLSSAGNASFLAVTSHRIGALVETAHLEAEQLGPVSETPSDNKGFSLLGAAKSAVRSVASRGGEKSANPVTCAVEVPMSAIHEIAPAAMGRSGRPVRFLRFRFADGSALSVKHPEPGQLADAIRLNLR